MKNITSLAAFSAVAGALAMASGSVCAQEFTLYTGPLKSGADHTYSWQMD